MNPSQAFNFTIWHRGCIHPKESNSNIRKSPTSIRPTPIEYDEDVDGGDSF